MRSRRPSARLVKEREGAPIPAYEPQLVTLAERAHQGDDWFHELKIDGYRIGCTSDSGRVTLTSRNHKDWTQAFPEVCEEVRHLRTRQVLLDGEIAVVQPDGRTSFQALQKRGRVRDGLVYFAFDILFLDGKDLRGLPLERRKQMLERLLGARSEHGVIRYMNHIVGNGPAVFEHASKLGAEGIVSKRRDRPYLPGRHDWCKTKSLQTADFVIAGFVRANGSRVAASSLLLGYYDELGQFTFAGNVGTGHGFTDKFLTELGRQLSTIEQRECPFAWGMKASGGVHWVEPRVVIEVAYLEWTDDGQLRHPTFQGFRVGKRPQECTISVEARRSRL